MTAEDAVTAVGRTDSCADHVAKGRRQMLESWIAAYGKTWEDREGEAFGRRPSCRECLHFSNRIKSAFYAKPKSS